MNMKRSIFILLTIFHLLPAGFLSQAQSVVAISQETTNLPVIPKSLDKYKVIDTSLFTITYEVKIMVDTNKPDDIQEDLLVLQIGKHISKSYSQFLFQADSINTEAIKNGLATSPIFQGIVPPIEVYRNYPENKNTVTYRTFANGPTFLYTEDKIKFEWKILPVTKKYLTYTCQKATTTFRGRNYEAWFTSEIPFSEGPYKFTGLPGLILQIQDTEGHYAYNCTGIKKEKQVNEIKMWTWKYDPTTREKLNAFLKRIHDNPIDFFSASGTPVMVVGKNNKIEPVSKRFKCAFNPIELE
jgi:GLPGLI family protein